MDTVLRWSANVTMLFRERPFLDRFAMARDAGFEAVEFWWPRGERLEDVERAITDAGVDVALFNMESGDLEAGERGYLNRPECHPAVLAALQDAISLARAVRCTRINAPVGKDSGADRERQVAAIADMLTQMGAIANGAGIVVTVEALNSFDQPTYLLSSTRLAVEWVRRAGPGIGLLFDAYHMGAMGEDIVKAPSSLEPAHVQFADFPGRHEPGTGRLPLRAFFEALRSSGYPGYVGVEYAPLAGTTESLRWWSEYAPRTR